MDLNNKNEFGNLFTDGTAPQDRDRRRRLGALLPEVPVEAQRQVLWLSLGVGALVFSGLMGWGPHGRWINGLQTSPHAARVRASSSRTGVGGPTVSIPVVRTPRLKGAAKAASGSAAVVAGALAPEASPTTKVASVKPVVTPVTEVAEAQIPTTLTTTAVAPTTVGPTSTTSTTAVATTVQSTVGASSTVDVVVIITTSAPTTAAKSTVAPTTVAALKLEPTVPAFSPESIVPTTSTSSTSSTSSTTSTTSTTAPAATGTAEATVFFGAGSSVIDGSGRAVLAPLADTIATLPSGSVVRIIGWASADGGAARNRILSIRRARAVRTLLQEMVGTRNFGINYQLEGWGEGASAENDVTKRRVTVELP